MKTHKLAELLLAEPDAEVTISVDVSTCCRDTGGRVHGWTNGRIEFVHLEDYPGGNVEEIILCLDGAANFRFIGELDDDACDCTDCAKKVSKYKMYARRWGYSGS